MLAAALCTVRAPPSNVIPAKAGTQSTGSGLNSAAASKALANASRALTLKLVWVPAGFAHARAPG